jgi:hypothetical protein
MMTGRMRPGTCCHSYSQFLESKEKRNRITHAISAPAKAGYTEKFPLVPSHADFLDGRIEGVRFAGIGLVHSGIGDHTLSCLRGYCRERRGGRRVNCIRTPGCRHGRKKSIRHRERAEMASLWGGTYLCAIYRVYLPSPTRGQDAACLCRTANPNKISDRCLRHLVEGFSCLKNECWEGF